MFALCSADPNIMGLLLWAQSDPLSVDLIVGDIRSQIAAEWLQIAQRSQFKPIGTKPVALSNGAIADPIRPPPNC